MNSKISFLFLIIIFFYSCGKKTEETKPIIKDVIETVFAIGILEADNMYNLVAQNEGYLIALNFEEGDMVTKGKTIAIIDNKENSITTQSASELLIIAQSNTNSSAPLLAQAKANIEISKQKMDQDAIQKERYQRLLENNSIAKIDFENADLAFKTSKTSYETAIENYKKIKIDADQSLINNATSKKISNIALSKNSIQALVTGKVFEKKKEVGDFVKKGDVIAVIGDPSFIYAKVNIDESSINKIKLNQEATIQLNTNKDKIYRAIVYNIAPSFDEVSQSFICKLKFLDTLEFNIIKTQLQANIISGKTENALLIPRNFIDFGGNVNVKGEKLPRKVTTKFVSNKYVHVLTGINKNMILITDQIEGSMDNTQNDLAGKY